MLSCSFVFFSKNYAFTELCCVFLYPKLPIIRGCYLLNKENCLFVVMGCKSFSTHQERSRENGTVVQIRSSVKISQYKKTKKKKNLQNMKLFTALGRIFMREIQILLLDVFIGAFLLAYVYNTITKGWVLEKIKKYKKYM